MSRKQYLVWLYVILFSAISRETTEVTATATAVNVAIIGKYDKSSALLSSVFSSLFLNDIEMCF